MSTALPPSHETLTVPEVMTSLRLSRFKVYDLSRSKQLQSFTIGRARRVPADALRTYIQSQLGDND